jgi:putative PIN family toxin of toxin-antitoxin system
MVVVLDCNIWISLALTQQLEFISSLQKNRITIAACKNLQDELVDVLLRPKFKKYFSKAYVEQLIQFYKLTTNSFEIIKINKVVTDEKDNYLFALCEVSNADYFITGDKLLLEVVKYQNTNITTLANFKTLVKQSP